MKKTRKRTARTKLMRVVFDDGFKPSMTVVNFGRHKGKTLYDIITTDPAYFSFLLQDAHIHFNKRLKKAIVQTYKDHYGTLPPARTFVKPLEVRLRESFQRRRSGVTKVIKVGTSEPVDHVIARVKFVDSNPPESERPRLRKVIFAKERRDRSVENAEYLSNFRKIRREEIKLTLGSIDVPPQMTASPKRARKELSLRKS